LILLREQSHKPTKKNGINIDGSFYLNTSVNHSTQDDEVDFNYYLNTSEHHSNKINYAGGSPYLDTSEDHSK
jgi:hypothetical protein